MKSSSSWVIRYPFIAPLVIFVTLIVLGAMAHPLWGDEAETAFFAKMIVKTGWPMGFDGVNMSAVNEATVLNKELVNHVTPPLQYYLVAASFFLFGQTAFTARLPFLILASLSLILFYYVSLRVSEGKRDSALIATIIYSLCVPMILFSSQARYYSLVIFSGLLLFYSSLALIDKNKKVWPYFSFLIAGLVYVYSHYLTFLFFYPSVYVAVAAFLIRKKSILELRAFTLKFVSLSVLIVGLFLPWYFYFKPGQGQDPMIYFDLVGFLMIAPFSVREVLFYFSHYNVFPFVFFGFAGILILYNWYRKRDVGLVFFPGVVVGTYLLFLGIFSATVSADNLAIVHSRYNLILIPFLILLVVYIYEQLGKISRLLAVAFLMLYLLSTIFKLEIPRSYLFEYVKEVVNPYQTADTLVADYLKAHADDGDFVFINYDRSHESLIFLLNDGAGGYVKELKFVNRIAPFNTRVMPGRNKSLPDYLYRYLEDPEWVILYSKYSKVQNVQYLIDIRDPNIIGRSKRIDLKNDYTETILPVFFGSDIARPELEWRSFERIEPTYDQQVFIYRKKNVESADEKKEEM